MVYLEIWVKSHPTYKGGHDLYIAEIYRASGYLFAGMPVIVWVYLHSLLHSKPHTHC